MFQLGLVSQLDVVQHQDVNEGFPGPKLKGGPALDIFSKGRFVLFMHLPQHVLWLWCCCCILCAQELGVACVLVILSCC